jgi:hypothetical protein
MSRAITSIASGPGVRKQLHTAFVSVFLKKKMSVAVSGTNRGRPWDGDSRSIASR